MRDEKKVIIYTKGSGENKDGRYGWAYTLENMISENNNKSDSFRTEMYAVLSALKSMDKSAAVEIRTNNEVIADLYNGRDKANKSKDLYDKLIVQKNLFKEAGGRLTIEFISSEEGDKHFDELRKMARDEIV